MLQDAKAPYQIGQVGLRACSKHIKQLPARSSLDLALTLLQFILGQQNAEAFEPGEMLKW